jgi:hypothetical protein
MKEQEAGMSNRLFQSGEKEQIEYIDGHAQGQGRHAGLSRFSPKQGTDATVLQDGPGVGDDIKY